MQDVYIWVFCVYAYRNIFEEMVRVRDAEIKVSHKVDGYFVMSLVTVMQTLKGDLTTAQESLSKASLVSSPQAFS